MASKVPKFGAWEGGENYTVYFDNARKTKNNGQAINPNDPQENPAMSPQKGTRTQAPPTPSRAESQGQQTKVPQFGAWDSGDNVGYTVYFENARNTKTSGPPKAENTVKPEPQEGRSKVPQFGAWSEGENVAYTAYFDNARKNKSDDGGLGGETHGEPQMNRDVADRARPPPPANGPKARPEQRGIATKEEGGPVRNTSRDGSETPHRGGRQTPGMHTPQHPRAGKSQLTPANASRGSQNSEKGTAIPQFGVWNTDPTKAEDFTGTFLRAREDRNAPLNKNTSTSHHQQTNQAKKKGCFPCFG